jgi:putative colanic acid biosynthesis glycosyltransferase WcaI
MRVLLLTQFFQPEPFAKGLPFARELVRRGHQVQVLTGFPHTPGGKIYNGYSVRAWQRESIEGIPVTRVPVYPSYDRSAIRRIMTYASFMISAAILGPALARPADVLYVYHPPITVGLAAIAFRRLRGTPFVIDIQDLWPDTLKATGMMSSPGMLDAVSRVCRIVYRNAAGIVVLSQGFARALADRGVPLERITVIHNWSLEGDLHRQVQEPDLAARLGMDQRFNVVFAGTFGLAQHLDTVLDAARLLQDSFPRIQFVLRGTGVEEPRLRRRAETERLANVRFLGWRPANEAGQAMALSDALLVHLKDDPLFAITIPSKTQAYLAVGQPIIMAVRGDAAHMVTEANAGLTVEPEDPRGLADAVVALYRLPQPEREAMGRNGRAYYETRLSLSAGVDKFEQVFAAVAEEAGRGRHTRE